MLLGISKTRDLKSVCYIDIMQIYKVVLGLKWRRKLVYATPIGPGWPPGVANVGISTWYIILYTHYISFNENV